MAGSNLLDFANPKSPAFPVSMSLGTDLDSILAAFYESGEIAVPPHEDNEAIIDQDYPIANLSIGITRLLEMFPSTGSPCQGKASFTLDDGDLHVMEPSCQETFVHTVPAQQLFSGRRLCISARKVKVSPPPPTPLARVLPAAWNTKALPWDKPPSCMPSTVSTRHRPPPNMPSSINTRHRPSQRSIAPLECSTLLLGTSVSRKVNLGPAEHHINLSRGGATIPNLRENILEYHDSRPQPPDKIIILCGAKDVLKNNLKRAQDLKPSLMELLQTVTELFPSSSVTFVSLLPIDLRHFETKKQYFEVASKVLGFNRLVRYLCRSVFKIQYLDIFSKFLDPRRRSEVNLSLYQDYVHLSYNKGIPKLEAELKNSLSQYHPQLHASSPLKTNTISFTSDNTPSLLNVSTEPPATETAPMLPPAAETAPMLPPSATAPTAVPSEPAAEAAPMLSPAAEIAPILPPSATAPTAVPSEPAAEAAPMLSPAAEIAPILPPAAAESHMGPTHGCS